MHQKEKYDFVIVGTGFASSFFLKRILETAPPSASVLILERGKKDEHAWQVENQLNSSIHSPSTIENPAVKEKVWRFNLGFGGGSNCWWGVVPRMLNNDFQLRSAYGIGEDWPLNYGDLEKYYAEVEGVMSVSGDSNDTPFQMSKPYPQPPHRFTNPDKVLKKAFPEQFFHLPTARARIATPNRPACCATGVCQICPINAKFTIQNELFHLFDDGRVETVLNADVQTVQTTGGMATGVQYVHQGKSFEANGETIILGANAIFNAHILQRSNINHPELGKYLDEQFSMGVTVELDGLDNFQGSTSITGHGYMLYDGKHRSEYAGCLMESFNIPNIRTEKGKWRQRLFLKFVFENLPSKNNAVEFNPDNPNIPKTIYSGISKHGQKGLDHLTSYLPTLLRSLPVEEIRLDREISKTESHVLGTTKMGNNPQDSVIDRTLVHHSLRNLLVLGGGAFPTISPANPTLTISALSLWSADHYLT